MIAGLADVLANRKKFVDEVSEVGSGIGTGSKESHQFHSKFANISFIEKSETGCVGLQNQGATCYLNSLIQSLFMLPEFRKAIYSFQYDQLKHGDESSCLTRQLQKLFVMLQMSVRGAVSTAGLTNSFGWTSSDSFVQQDVQECMAIIFEYMNQQCDKMNTFFTSSWEGKYLDGLECQKCFQSRGNKINFRDLQLQVQNQFSLQQSLQSYIEQELLDGIECDHCHERTLHKKGFRLLSLPYILSLQLKRFDINYETLQRIKINDKLSFPFQLDMTTYLDSSSGLYEPMNQRDAEHLLLYDLIAVLIHTGSAFAGHYLCYVRKLNEKTGLTNETAHGSWIRFNDSNVSQLKEDEMIRIFDCDMINSSSSHESSGPVVSSDSSNQQPANTNTTSTPIIPAGSNAYMLIYRQRSSSNINCVTDDEIPFDLKEWIQNDNETFLKLKAEWEYERSYLHLNLLYHKILFTIKIHKTSSLQTLLELTYDHIAKLHESNDNSNESSSSLETNQMKLKSNAMKSFDHDFDKAIHLKPVPLKHHIRLRVYDSLRGVLMKPLMKYASLPSNDSSMGVSSQSNGGHELCLHHIPMEILKRTLYVEENMTDNNDDDDDDIIPVEVVIFQPSESSLTKSSSTGFSAPSVCSFSAKKTIQEFYRLIVNHIMATHATIRSRCDVMTIEDVLKHAIITIFDIQNGVPTILNDSKYDAVVCTDIIKANDRIYVDIMDNEITNDTTTMRQPRMIEYFNMIYNKIVINYRFHNSDASGIQQQCIDGEIEIDQRSSLQQLKSKLADHIAMDTNLFAIHKTGKSNRIHDTMDDDYGMEMKDLTRNLIEFGLEDGSSVIIRVGRPLLPSEYRLHCYLEIIGNENETLSLNENQTLLNGRFLFVESLIINGNDSLSSLKMMLVDIMKQKTTDLISFHPMISFLTTVSISSPTELPLRLRLLEKSVDGALKCGPVLRDDLLHQSIPSIADGIGIVIQLGSHCKGEITRDHILLNIRQWIPIRMSTITDSGDKGDEILSYDTNQDELSPPIEITMLKTSTYIELKDFICKIWYDSSTESSDDLLLVKPFAWQLKDKSNLHKFKWNDESQPRPVNLLMNAPWRLQDNSMLLFIRKSDYLDSLAYLVNTNQDKMIVKPTDHFVESKPVSETGFRIYNRQEQEIRKDEEKRERDERKEAIAARMEAMAALQLQRTLDKN